MFINFDSEPIDDTQPELSKSVTKDFAFYAEKFDEVETASLNYAVDMGKYKDNTQINIIKTPSFTYSVAMSHHSQNIITTELYKKNNMTITCMETHCQLTNKTSFMPKLDLISQELVFKKTLKRNGRECQLYKARTKYDLLPNNHGKNINDNTNWEYSVCIDTEYGFQHFINGSVFNRSGKIFGYSIKLQKFNRSAPTIKIPAFVIDKATCGKKSVNVSLVPLKDKQEPEFIIRISKHGMFLDEHYTVLSESRTGEKQTLSVSPSNRLQPGQYSLEVCTSSFCTREVCAVDG